MTALPILLPMTLLVAGVLGVLAGLWRVWAAKAVALVALVATLAGSAAGLWASLTDGPLRHEVGGWAPPIGIEYVLDPLSGFIGCVVSVVALAVLVYPAGPGFGSSSRNEPLVYPLAMLLLCGLFGVTMTGDLFNLFVFLEIYAIATYALVALGGDKALFASFRYLILGSIGSGLYLLGVGYVYFSTGTLNMADAAERLAPLAGGTTVIAAAVLIVGGLAVKTALFPLHVWLPDAHTHAPPAVAAILAALQVKVGAYALIRILYDVFGIGQAEAMGIGTMLAWAGAAGVVFGSVMAIRQEDFKRVLAYSTVAQLGYIGIGIGLGTVLGLIGALFHVMAHSMMKSTMFLVAGAVYEGTGVREITRFAGLGRRMPVLMAGFAGAAIAMVGLPPTAGFFSKWYLVLGTLDAGMWPLAVVIVGSSLLTGIYFLRVIERIYVAQPADDAIKTSSEPGAGVLAPVLALAAGVIVTGVANVYIVEHILRPAATALVGGP